MLIVMWFCDLTITAAINVLHRHGRKKKQTTTRN